VIDGGTHNPAAPPFDFLDLAFLPLLRRMGASVEVELVRPGFYPAGGGQIRAAITPASRLGRLELVSRGALVRGNVRAVVANLGYSIAQREARAAGAVLGWEGDALQALTLTGSPGPGNAASVIVESEHVTDVFTGFGERGVRAELVAEKAATEAKRYLDSNVAVGEHLADQLLLPMALGDGGSFTTLPPTSHTTTNATIIRKFVDVEIVIDAGEVTTVRVG
jgi:RNA 3'-terminal phosphate cyclase (ATP)